MKDPCFTIRDSRMNSESEQINEAGGQGEAKLRLVRIYVMAFTKGLKTAERLSGIFAQWQDAEARFFAPARIMEAEGRS